MSIEKPSHGQTKISRFFSQLEENKRMVTLVLGILVLLGGIYYLYISAGLRVVNIIPKNGMVETPDTFQIIVFDFSEPIDTETAIIETNPPRIVKTLTLPDYPHRLSIIPAIVGWNPGTEYTITITGLTSQDGTRLRIPITYKYLNTFDFDRVYEDAPY